MGKHLQRTASGTALYAAALAAMKQSQWKASTQRFEMDFLTRISALQKALLSGTYEQRPFFEFTLHERGKIRHIRSMHIDDRVVQRSACDNVLTPTIRPQLVYDNGASLTGKGISFTRRRLHAHLEQYVRRHGPDGFVLVLDFSKFFDNIAHAPLLRMLEPILRDDEMLDLVRRMVATFRVDVSYMSEEEAEAALWKVWDSVADERIPAELKTGRRFLAKSLGIGAQISQDFGVFYPTPLDIYCKVIMGLRYFGRYMDDVYIIHHNKRRLQLALEGLRGLAVGYGLHINERKTHIIPLRRGFTFMQVKYQVRPDGRITRRLKGDRFTRERRKLKKYRRLLDAGRMTRKDISNAYQSWRGNMRGFACRRSVQSMDALYRSLFVER